MQEPANAIRNKSALLFVGAGVSMNLGVPSWSALTAHMAEQLGINPQEFATAGDPQTLAEYYVLQTGSIGPLRSWMDVEWHRDAEKRVRLSKIHRLIVKLGFPVIYTTNYDRYLELAHEALGVRYAKTASLSDLIAPEAGVTQIVKFHSDFEDDRSLVLTESSHFDRLPLEGPLDLKLRTDLLNRVALFIGYSVSDVSVSYLIYRLHKLWSGSGSSQGRPSAYVYLGRHNPIQARVLESWGIVPLVTELEDIGEGLKRLLASLASEGNPSHGRGQALSKPRPRTNHKARRSRRKCAM